MVNISSKTQRVLAFSGVIFLVLIGVSAGVAISGLGLTLPQAFYVLTATGLTFLVLSLALIVYLIRQWNSDGSTV